MINANTQNVSPVSQTPDELLKQQLKQQLQQLIPQAFSEGKLDIDTLKGLMGDDVLAPNFESYGLNWAGKHEVYGELKTPTSQTLTPQPDESVDFDSTQNLFIEGDNLAVLKILQKSYYNRIKMIYIDPPYNTGNDRFIYPDDYSESLAEYQARAGQLDDDGNLSHSDGMRSNRKENGQYHSNWLNMMYPRLALAKNLLRDDGVIFVSIDDNEVANLRLLMDEVFGEENFESTIIPVVNPGGRDYKQVAVTNEYILGYAKTDSLILNELNKEVNFKFKDSRGGYELRELRNRNPKFHSGNRPNLFYPFYVNPDIKDSTGYHSVSLTPSKDYSIEVRPYNSVGKESVWRWGKVKSEKNIVLDDLDASTVLAKQKKDGNWNIYEKNRKSTTKVKSVWNETSMRTEDGTRLVRKLFNASYFDHPKSLSLVSKCIQIGSSENDIILDFFAGSSTTAHAVMALNAEDAQNCENKTVGKRKFIMVQIPEATEEDSEAYKAGFPTISEISKERIRRAGQQILADNPDLKDSNLDIGFKAYKLIDSNFIPWQQPDSYDADSLLALLEKHVNPLVADATDSGLVTELMLKEGYTLTADIEEMDGFYLVNQPVGHEMSTEATLIKADTMTLAIVLEDMSKDKTAQLIALKPSKTIILDNAFSDDDNKANSLLQFEDAGLVVGCV